MQTEVFEVSRQEIPQLQHSNEFVKEHDAAVMRQTPVIPGDFDISGRSSHFEPRLTKSEVRLER
jgi:hypothetical protein